MTRYALNEGWGFTPDWDDALLGAPASPALEDDPLMRLLKVRLPHTVKEMPLDCFDDADFQLLSGYVRRLEAPREWEGKTIRLVLDGAAHRSEVFCNGESVGVHECGWTAGEFDLTPFLRAGATNTIAVRLDSRESLDQPPFGGVVDYLAYGGLYREAHLEVTGRARIADVFARPDHLGSLGLDAQIEGELDGLSLRIALDGARGERLLDESHPLSEHRFTASFQTEGITPWSPDRPDLYRLSIALVDDEGREIDAEELRIGFRTIEWRAEGLFLNGRPFALRGLNRHQSYPHLGYAAPARAQRLDADILKGELGCTVVRTSHYPQSHHFIERCDEIGLLVITEIPGWQHIGGSEWKTRAVRNTIDMVRQWRNHPSIIAWGVRINESQDDDAFYARTNAAARELDPTRPTTGVRNFPKSHLREDVYAYNDFIHSGSNRGVDPKKKVTPDPGKGYFVSEHNGHMFPTKAYDDEEHRLSQALRHARVQNDAAGAEGIAGAIGWCLADYQTHKDFGSGDRVCHHGVMDQFRNPKLAAALYASQKDPAEGPVLEPSSTMDIGEHPGGALGDIVVFTNAQAVRLYRNDELVGEFSPDRRRFPHLPHPPVVITDTIGDLMERHEGFDHRTAERVKRVLRDAAAHGPTGLPPRTMLTAALLVASKRFTLEEATRLYNRWMAPWGGESVVWRFEAVSDGEVIASCERAPGNRLILRASVDTHVLVDGDTWDMATVRIEAVDEFGARRTYAQRALRFSVEGDAELVGPDALPLIGGACGAYVRSIGKAGSARLTVSCQGAEPLVVDFTVEKQETAGWR